MAPHARPRHLLAWSAIFSLAACNAIWGIDDGRLAAPDSGLAGAPPAELGGAPPAASGAAGQPAIAGESGEHAGGVAGNGAASGAGGDDTSPGGVSGGVGGSGGASSGSGGTMSGTGGGGTGPGCSGCKAGEQQTESQSCGRCGTGTQSRSRTCDDKCTWGAWSGWGICSQCDAKPYRCCEPGKWEWCYESDCAWTHDCEPCVASSCPEC